MKINTEDELYFMLVNNILNNETFKEIEFFSHHGTTRMNHSMRVSYFSYKLAKKLHLDYKSAAVSGLLHDFFMGEEDGNGFVKNIKFQRNHPILAAKNAMKHFSITKKERNIIETHMCPFTKPSKYLEGWIVSFVDKAVGTYEYGVKYKRQLKGWVLSFVNTNK